MGKQTDTPANNPEQSLDEFVTEMAVTLGRFKENWNAEHAKDPERWPLKLSAGDWYEQFLAFLS